MAKQQTLQATKRDQAGSAHSKRLRRSGIIPAVVYGSEQRNYSVQVSSKEFSDVLRNQSSDNFLVNLEIEGADEKTKLAMVQDVQHNPLSGELIHIDFHAVREDEELHANVPIELLGDPIGVKEGGVLEHILHSIEVQCRPADLPDIFEIDITEVAIDQSVHVSDLEIPEGVTIFMDGDVVVANIAEPRVIVTAEDEEEEAVGEEAEEGEDESDDEDSGESKSED